MNDISPEVWRIYLKQAYFNSMIDGLLAAVIILVVAITWKKVWAWSEDVDEAAQFLLGVFYVGCLIVALVFLYGSASGFYNPEYVAIQNLLSAVGGK